MLVDALQNEHPIGILSRHGEQALQFVARIAIIDSFNASVVAPGHVEWSRCAIDDGHCFVERRNLAKLIAKEFSKEHAKVALPAKWSKRKGSAINQQKTERL